MDQYILFRLHYLAGARDLYYNGSMLHNIESLNDRSPHPFAEPGFETATKYDIKDCDDVVVETVRVMSI